MDGRTHLHTHRQHTKTYRQRHRHGHTCMHVCLHTYAHTHSHTHVHHNTDAQTNKLTATMRLVSDVNWQAKNGNSLLFSKDTLAVSWLTTHTIESCDTHASLLPEGEKDTPCTQPPIQRHTINHTNMKTWILFELLQAYY